MMSPPPAPPSPDRRALPGKHNGRFRRRGDDDSPVEPWPEPASAVAASGRLALNALLPQAAAPTRRPARRRAPQGPCAAESIPPWLRKRLVGLACKTPHPSNLSSPAAPSPIPIPATHPQKRPSCPGSASSPSRSSRPLSVRAPSPLPPRRGRFPWPGRRMVRPTGLAADRHGQTTVKPMAPFFAAGTWPRHAPRPPESQWRRRRRRRPDATPAPRPRRLTCCRSHHRLRRQLCPERHDGLYEPPPPLPRWTGRREC